MKKKRGSRNKRVSEWCLKKEKGKTISQFTFQRKHFCGRDTLSRESYSSGGAKPKAKSKATMGS